MTDHEEKEASKRPEDSDFKQQRLPAWQPLLTPKWVILTFLVVGVVFIPIGTLIVTASNDVVEISVRYDNHPNSASCNYTEAGDCEVQLTLTVPEKMEGPVYVYYELSNYFQNHRRYVKSRSDTQLRGETGDTGTCSPLEENSDGEIFYPCGLIANSFFNDTFELCVGDFTNCVDNSTRWRKDGIAWESDVDHKFKEFSSVPNGYTNISADGVTELPSVVDEDFIVWMRTAGLPTFRKLHRKIERDFEEGEEILIKVDSSYPVSEFDGEKRLVLSTTSWLGGKNRFLGWSYIAVAIVCILLALVFHVKNQTSPRKLGDMQYFQWAGAGQAASSAEPAQS